MAYSLDVQETSIDMTTQFLKIRQIGDMLLHSKVIRIIDGGLSPKSSAFLKVLLDVRLLELNVNAGVYPVGDDTGSELGGRSFGNLPLEEELHPIRTAKIDIFSDHFLEEHAAGDCRSRTWVSENSAWRMEIW